VAAAAFRSMDGIDEKELSFALAEGLGPEVDLGKCRGT